jgi:PAS domain S-box-containing protein
VAERVPSRALSALILAPRGRDATIASSLIEHAGVESKVCETLAELIGELGDYTAFALMTEEAIRSANLKPLVQWIGRQPTWSDLPFILITDHGGGLERNPVASRWLDALGNVSFIERPFHSTTLISIARTAFKSRRRQFEARNLFEQLRESEVRLRTALKAGNLGPWEFDFSSRRLLLSEEFKSAFGPGGDFGVEMFFATVHPDDRGKVTAALQRSVSTGDDYAVEFRRRWPDGTIHWIDTRARMVRDATGQPQRLIGLSVDITERKSAEEALHQLNEELERRVSERTAQLQHAHDELVSQIAERERTEEQLRHMQKIESIGELTGGVAHDFNNLLTAVIGNLELLRKRIGSDPSIDRLIDGALQGAQRGASLTQRLLAFARRQALEPRPVDLAGLVRGIASLLRRSIGPTIEIEFDLPDSLPAVQVDANQIELALLNLAVNARDAMPSGGRIDIALRRCNTQRTADLAAGDYVCLRVSDSGSGMDADTLRRAVEPFFSTKGIGKGTGLGLSMVHGVALQLKGALRLESTLGRGTEAELWLPVSKERPVDAGVDAQKPDDIKGATVLLVDDDFLINLSTKALLEDLGHTVIETSSGTQALDVLRTEEPIDLMITDYAMPGMTGVQLAEAAREMRPNLPILLATGYADLPGSVPNVSKLSKPFHQRQLAEQITALLGRHTKTSPADTFRPDKFGLKS